MIQCVTHKTNLNTYNINNEINKRCSNQFKLNSRKSNTESSNKNDNTIKFNSSKLFASLDTLPKTFGECKVFKSIKGSKRNVSAKIYVQATIDHVWKILNDYKNLKHYIPNLEECVQMPNSKNGNIQLKQKFCVSCEFVNIIASAVVELDLLYHSERSRDILITMIEGDFKRYNARFSLSNKREGEYTTLLLFEAKIEPLEHIPDLLFSYAVENWLPKNLKSLISVAEKLAETERSAPTFAAKAMEENISLIQNNEKKDITTIINDRNIPSNYLGCSSVPIPSKLNTIPKKIRDKMDDQMPFSSFDNPKCPINEVHLRNLDTSDNHIHRRAVVFVSINASRGDVWNVLTDYSNLSHFIPDLKTSEILAISKSAPKHYKRIKQKYKKSSIYIDFEFETILDVVERDKSEIQFRQVEGCLDIMQGKWMLSDLKSEGNITKSPGTLLKYAVEIKHNFTHMPFRLLEPYLEKIASDDLMKNIDALRIEVLKRMDRPSLSLLSTDFEVLKYELERCYGKEKRILPTREQLRSEYRSDLEKAIASHGGPSNVSERLGWEMGNKKRRRRGYWEEIQNLEKELIEFNELNNLPLRSVPKKQILNKCGRQDLRRAIEKWGGITAVTELLKFELIDDEIDKSSINKKMIMNIRDIDFFNA